MARHTVVVGLAEYTGQGGYPDGVTGERIAWQSPEVTGDYQDRWSGLIVTGGTDTYWMLQVGELWGPWGKKLIAQAWDRTTIASHATFKMKPILGYLYRYSVRKLGEAWYGSVENLTQGEVETIKMASNAGAKLRNLKLYCETWNENKRWWQGFNPPELKVMMAEKFIDGLWLPWGKCRWPLVPMNFTTSDITTGSLADYGIGVIHLDRWFEEKEDA